MLGVVVRALSSCPSRVASGARDPLRQPIAMATACKMALVTGDGLRPGASQSSLAAEQRGWGSAVPSPREGAAETV